MFVLTINNQEILIFKTKEEAFEKVRKYYGSTKYCYMPTIEAETGKEIRYDFYLPQLSRSKKGNCYITVINL